MTAEPLRRLDVLADGTVRQQSPVTGTVVWTVPDRSHRPLRSTPPPQPLAAGGRETTCPFCRDRYLETPPEKARLVRMLGAPEDAEGPDRSVDPGGASPATGWQIIRGLTAEQVVADPAQVRRFPNLFEILPWGFWEANYGATVPDPALRWAQHYLSTPSGRAHVRSILDARARAAGAVEVPAVLDDAALLRGSLPFFAGMHDLVVPRRHYTQGAVYNDQLCSSGDLTVPEHREFMALAVHSLAELAYAQPAVRYVSVFQNWLAPAGASLDHLHKQLVAMDEHGPLLSRIIATLQASPNLFNSHVIDPAIGGKLVIAANDHAIAVAGVGHRYPTIEVYSTGAANLPWEHSTETLCGISDLLHACHAATGPLVPTNEEWHYRPRAVDVAMPWRINLKWRVSTLAGFEGGTKVNVNTISPFELRDRMVRALRGLRAEGRIADTAIGDECRTGPGSLSYRRG